VEGRLQIRSYDDREGIRRIAAELWREVFTSLADAGNSRLMRRMI